MVAQVMSESILLRIERHHVKRAAISRLIRNASPLVR